MNTVELVGDLLMLAGALAFLVGALGMMRLPDLYSRLSGVTISGAFGTALILIGLLLHQPSWPNLLKISLALVIQLATTAVGGSAMARAGYLTGSPQAEATLFDDLAVEEGQELDAEGHPGQSRPDNGS
ncbi:monovalent cation/H(+) antiporter subunit G [Nocardiopsis sp. HNM0947]|uniref:Monovalent cation/H(+) antiporter subunit G n=1 Tax=Nocardiopsis coralli TaxID=2772213 RepID=A0ABR9P3G6_9ACTN|nr:monovalent cation/H(+) antiporter subunit G [Nocardiopsis coralli]MBE2998379.1 monovalent cation/H(+) antiporter subunit G [Nocardiopsis coralli]